MKIATKIIRLVETTMKKTGITVRTKVDETNTFIINEGMKRGETYCQPYY